MKTTPRAFLCHATEDKEITRPLAEELRRNGIDTLFATFDKYFKPWNPETDALQIAADLVNGKDGTVQAMAQEYNWPPRRMNPAISYLVENNLVGARDFSRRPWVRHWLYKTPETRRFVRDRS